MPATTTPTPLERAQQRATYLTGLMWHAGTFVIINAFFWILDLGLDPSGRRGLDWAFWITLVWGLALAFHALAYFVDGRRIEERKVQEYLSEERQRETQST
jgi:hypothetical protein